MVVWLYSLTVLWLYSLMGLWFYDFKVLLIYGFVFYGFTVLWFLVSCYQNLIKFPFHVFRKMFMWYPRFSGFIWPNSITFRRLCADMRLSHPILSSLRSKKVAAFVLANAFPNASPLALVNSSCCKPGHWSSTEPRYCPPTTTRTLTTGSAEALGQGDPQQRPNATQQGKGREGRRLWHSIHENLTAQGLCRAAWHRAHKSRLA